MNRYTLRIVSSNSNYIHSCQAFASLYNISNNNELPSLYELITSPKTIYNFDKKEKHAHRFIYFFSKLLNKKQSKFHNLKALFSRPCNSNCLIIAHHTKIFDILSYHLAHTLNTYTIYVTNITENTKKKASEEFDRYIINLFKQQCITPDLNFHGNIIITNWVNYTFIVHLAKKFPNANCICFKSLDYMGSNSEQFKKNFLEELSTAKTINRSYFYSYSKADALNYGLIYEPNGVDISYLSSLRVPYSERIYGVFFAGIASGKRFSKVLTLIKQLERLSISYCLVLTGLSFAEQKELTVFSKSSLSKVIFHPVSYRKLIDLTRQSIAILDIYRLSSDEGYSYRIGEAIALNCKVLSNRTKLYTEKFFKPNNILIGEQLFFSDSKLKTFLNDSESSYDTYDTEIFDIKHQCFCNQDLIK